MLVETGQPLLISDLDLAEIAAPVVRLRVVPGKVAACPATRWNSSSFSQHVRHFHTADRARMNAAFPVISPAVDCRRGRPVASSMPAISTTTGWRRAGLLEAA